MERIENAMVQDRHWQDNSFEAQMARAESCSEAEELSAGFDAEIARMDKLDDELRRLTRIIEGPGDA